MAITFASTCFYACTAVVVAARLFGQEAIVFSDMGSYKTFLLRRFYRPARYPTAAVALSLTALLFPWYFYWQVSQPGAGSSAGRLALLIIISQIGCFVIPPVLLAWYLKLDLRATFSLERPSQRTVLGAATVGFSCPILAAVVAYWQQRWFAPTDDAAQTVREIVGLVNSMPLVLAFVVFALVPACCEEFLFRGWLLAGLREKLKPVTLCLVVGLIFGLFHVDAYRMLTTGLLGALLTFVCWRSGSIVPAVLIHLINNGVAVLYARYQGAVDAGAIDPAWSVWNLAWSSLLLACGLTLIEPSTRSKG
jgi:membrane protease YdiL (CAAX protease family)